MKHLKVIPADKVSKDRPVRVTKPVEFGVIFPDQPDHYHGPALDQPDFDGSPRLLPKAWLDSDDQAA
jgi:hypothetical protein